MERLIIETNDEEALEIIMNLVEKKKVTVVKAKDQFIHSPSDIMNDIASNSPFSSIEDPVSWQKEVRNNRDIHIKK